MPFTLVTQSFGRENEYRRVIFAILSFYAVADQQTPTLLFTDKPEYFEAYFKGLPVQYVLLSPEKIKSMRGEIDFLHRMKIALIEEAMQLSDTDILYTDSDTFFLQNPEPYVARIAPDQSFMHLREYQFEEVRHMALPAGRAARAFIQYIEAQDVWIPGTDIKVNACMSSWNAGVILLHKNNSVLLDKVYQLTDLFFPASQSHASEQYAFSVVLQSLTKLEPVDDVIYHYWYNIKKKVIDEFLEKRLPQIEQKKLTERLTFIQQSILLLPKMFEQHIDALKDNAIQAFNNKQYARGLSWALRAFTKGALMDKQFVRDFLYHTKIKALGK